MTGGFLPRGKLQALIDALRRSHKRVVGPVVRDGAIVFDDIARAAELPIGWHDEQAPGHYRLVHDRDERCFAWANGPQALKPLTYAPREVLWRVARNDRGELAFSEAHEDAVPTAVIGARACDLAALHIHDRHFAYSAYADAYYNRRRRALFIVAVDCAHPAATCFCHSTGDGPSATSGFDLALTELDEGFLVRAKSDPGRTVAEALPLDPATPAQLARAAAQGEAAVDAQTRTLPGRNLRDALLARLAHPRWQDVASRCLACGNCTSVCPTCFCHQEGEAPAMDGRSSEHYREWDSCFTAGHSYIHGWIVRGTTDLRYRQWLVHKLASWHDQYGRSGCTGCGRCIAWCPAGIDITEEAHALMKEPVDARP
jgi:ferredoxin